MMSRSLPLGEKEGSNLEFKGREALETPETIARAVVGMLNTGGGEVWVGISEEEDRAVRIEAIPEPERERHRLWTYLVDVIEPSPSGAELVIEELAGDEGGPVLRLSIEPEPVQQPYAFVSKGGRLFLTRVGDRDSPMSRLALESHFAKAGPGRDTALDDTLGRVIEERKRAQEEGGEFLWLRLEPVVPMEIDLPQFQDHLVDPTLTGTRRAGWSFTLSLFPPLVLPDRLTSDPKDPRTVEIRRDGGLVFKAPLSSLHWRGEKKELWPISLLEYPISAFRLARSVYSGHLGKKDHVVADLALFGLKGWLLRPNSPKVQFPLAHVHEYRASTDLVWEKPLVFEFEEVESEPDRCGYRLVKRVYEAFDFSEAQIPKEFDRKAGRLVLPE